jgi:hypothetical protein
MRKRIWMGMVGVVAAMGCGGGGVQQRGVAPGPVASVAVPGPTDVDFGPGTGMQVQGEWAAWQAAGGVMLSRVDGTGQVMVAPGQVAEFSLGGDGQVIWRDVDDVVRVRRVTGGVSVVPTHAPGARVLGDAVVWGSAGVWRSTFANGTWGQGVLLWPGNDTSGVEFDGVGVVWVNEVGPQCDVMFGGVNVSMTTGCAAGVSGGARLAWTEDGQRVMTARSGDAGVTWTASQVVATGVGVTTPDATGNVVVWEEAGGVVKTAVVGEVPQTVGPALQSLRGNGDARVAQTACGYAVVMDAEDAGGNDAVYLLTSPDGRVWGAPQRVDVGLQPGVVGVGKGVRVWWGSGELKVVEREVCP